MMFPVSTLRTALLLLSALTFSSSSSISSSLCTTPTDGSRSFTSSLMPAVYTPDGTSGSFSPTSLRQAFFMVGQGAGPTDASEIRSTLKTCSSADDTPFSDLAAPIVGLEQESDDFTLTIANALYVDEAFPINPTYQTDLETYWSAEATTVDFVNEPTDAKNSINDFVSDSTRGIIPSILESDPSPDTVLMLINALYLKARWAQPFDGAWPQQFSDPERDGGSASMVQTMSKIMFAPYVNGGTYTAVSLPYSEEGYEMLLVRPGGCAHPTSGEAVHLSHLINTCLDSTLSDAMTQVMDNEGTRVRVTMPKFHVTWRTDTTFKSTLKDLGLTKIFSANDADLSGISSDASQLFVSSVAHMADVKVDEQGTEAAAVTSIGISVTSMPVEPNVHFKADVPFVYAIWHRPTQEVLFAGWVNVDALEVDVQSTVPGGDVEPKSAAATSLPVCSSSGPVCAAAESGGTDSGSGSGADVEEQQQGGQEKEEEVVKEDDPSPTTPPVTEEPKGDGVQAAGAGDDTPSSASMMRVGGLGLWTAAAGSIVAKLLI